MRKEELVEKIKRRLGAPMVKIELDDTQIFDNIDYTRAKYIKWAIGNATQEVYMTLLLRGGQTLYDLPANTTNVLGYSMNTMGSIHTLFTIENYLYQMGMFDQVMMRGGGNDYTLVSYHIARGFLETIKRYVVDSYNFRYHKYTNQLEISPPPPSSSMTTVTSAGPSGDVYVENTPGYLLLRTYQIEGTDEDIYGNEWILDYATALTKISLGRVRSKFANFSAVGSNVGLSMDGDTLLQEGQNELEHLNETLKNEEVWEGLGIFMG
jgi:hypothetical protein